MGEAGILHEDARVELIDGEIIDMSPIGSRHSGTVNQLSRLFERAIDEHAIVAAQNPFVLGNDSEPQPDIALLKPRDDFYTRSHPRPDDVLLLIEVADTSAPYDRTVKIPLYAQHGIPEVWLLDLPHKRLEVYRTPRAEHAAYQHAEQHFDGTVSPALLSSVAIDVADLFVS
jgi:Uma2 family endonuclease